MQADLRQSRKNGVRPRPGKLPDRPTRFWHSLTAVIATLVIAITLLMLSTHARVADQRAQDETLVQIAVDGAAADMERTILEMRRALGLFSQAEAGLLRDVAAAPEDDALYQVLLDKIDSLFPAAFAVTLADRHGDPIVDDFSGHIEEVCRLDIRSFASSEAPPPLYVHPNPEGYHVDLMVTVETGATEPTIFFVSFRPELFSRSLAAQALPYHELMLLHTERPGLIEINREGARDSLAGDFYLSEKAFNAIAYARPVAGTLWTVAAVPRSGVLGAPHADIWITTGLIIVVLLGVGSVAIFQLYRADRRTRTQNDLLRAVSRAESRFIAEGDVRLAFESILDDMLLLTASDYGFVGEIRKTEDEKPYLHTYAITNIAWDEKTRRFYEEHAPTGMDFYNLDTLFGAVMRTGQPVISNDPSNDSRAGGLPPGHPALTAFLGVPLYHGPHFVGMIGLANRAGGYNEQIIDHLEPILRSSANLFWALQSERHRAATESALRDSSSRHRAILNAMFDGIVTLNEHGLIESFNPAAERIFGYETGNVLGRSMRQLFGSEYYEQQGRYLLNALKGHVPASVQGLQEAVGRREDGTEFPIEISISDTELDDQRIYTCIIRDVTKRKHIEQNLRRTTALQRAILDSANFSIISTDEDGVIQTFNAGAQRMLGYSEDEMVGRETPALIHDPAEVVQRAHDLSQELGYPIEPGFEAFVTRARLGHADEREWTYIRKDGSRFPVMLSVTALHDDTGRLTGFLGIGSDITERRKIDRMKSEFVSTVSHELRTPLTSIRGSLSLMAAGAVGEIPTQAQKLVEIAANNTDRLVRLINDILDMEKIESGRMQFNFELQPLLPIVEKSIAANQAYAGQHDIRIELDNSAQNTRVDVDADRITQVIDNLLSNAIKFTHPGTTIKVEILPRRSSVRVSVADQGAGVPADFQSRIFSKFAQADASDSRLKGGTGLGLTISKSIVESHNGRIGYRSTPGEGATFYFDLPIMQRTETGHETLPADGKQTILICEDDPDVVRLISMLLERAGWRTEAAHSAEEALQKLQHQRFSAMTLDQYLPGMSGLELLREIRAHAATAALPVVVVSVGAEELRAQLAGNELQVAGWVAKPIDEHRLLERLRQAMSAGEALH